MIKRTLPSLGLGVLMVTWIGIFGLVGCAAPVSESAFLDAAKNGTVPVIEKYEGDVSVTDANGWTALHLAAYGGHVEVVGRLLDRNAGIDSPTIGEYNDYNQVAPLHLAVHKGHIPVIKLLIERGVDVMAQDGNIHNAIFFTQDESIRRMIWDAVPEEGI